MGSYCDLKFGNKSIIWDKNSVHPVIMSIFTAQDQNYRYKNEHQILGSGESESLAQEAECKYVSNVRIVKKRLDVLGFGLKESEKDLKREVKLVIDGYSEYLEQNSEKDILFNLYSNYKEILSSASLECFIEAYRKIFEITDDFLEAEKKFKDSKDLVGYLTASSSEYVLGLPMTDLRYTFRILLECFDNDDVVDLDISSLINSGYYKYTDDLVEISRELLTGS